MGIVQTQAEPCVAVHDLSGAIVRRGTAYRFLTFRDAGLEQDSRFAGVLRDVRYNARTHKAISPDVAQVFESASPHCRVDALLPGTPRDERNRVIAALVLDDILEIDIGSFASGCATYRCLIERDDALVGTSSLAELSMAAIRHAQRLELDEPDKLAGRLYFWNRLPITHTWRSLWSNADAVRQYLGADAGGACRRELEDCFSVASPPRPNFHWLSWRRARHGKASNLEHLYKLYVSPLPHQLDEAFAQVVRVLKHCQPRALKVGSEAAGLLRPDKLILYFDDANALFACAEHLAPWLAGLTPHGVPFSCELAGSGLLSWGVDPPSAKAVDWLAESSWRTWLCDQLATAMIAAGKCAHTVEAWRYALVRVALAGVDTRQWAPG